LSEENIVFLVLPSVAIIQSILTKKIMHLISIVCVKNVINPIFIREMEKEPPAQKQCAQPAMLQKGESKTEIK
jgi:hypothetical protein